MSDSNDKINLIQDEIDQVKDQVQQNISLVIDRGENLENLADKSENLSKNSLLFRNTARRLKWKMFMKKLKMTALLLFIIFIIIMMILFWACGFGLHCGK